jgi:hypothetical protein
MDVLSRNDDHIFLSPDDVQLIAADEPQVAEPVPTIAERLRGETPVDRNSP